MARSKEVNFVTDSASARLITKICNSSEKSQAEIAQEIGFEKPNVMTMLKQGRIKMPIARIPAFCKATNSDPGLLLNTVLQEHYPEISAVLAEIKLVSIAPEETHMIKAMRKAKREKERESKSTLTWKKDLKSRKRFITHCKTQLMELGN